MEVPRTLVPEKTIKVKISKKKLPIFFKKTADKNLEKHSITSRKYTVTYCPTLEEVPGLSRLEKPENRQKTSENLKQIQV